jgi:hypothetical protein
MRSCSKNLSLLIALLFITSQVFANTSIDCCDMDESAAGMSMSGMDHSSHNMDMMVSDKNSSDTSSSDCCDMDCKCPVGGCSSSYITQTSQNIIIYSQNSNSLNSKDRFITSVEIPSLYRPPIVS